MQQDDGVSVAMQGTDAPCTKRFTVIGGNGNILDLCVVARSDGLGANFGVWSQRAPSWMKCQFHGKNADGNTHDKPDSNKG
jgi:hypothetical protein